MKWFRKFLLLFLGLISPLLLLLFKYPTFIKKLNDWFPNKAGEIELITVAVIVVAMVGNYLASFISPQKKLDKHEKEKNEKLRNGVNDLVTMYGEIGIELKFNIMVERKRKFLFPCLLEPGKTILRRKIIFWPTLFRVIWTDPPNHKIKNFKITTNQGTSGLALRGKKIVSYDIQDLVSKKTLESTLNLNRKQAKETSKLTLLASAPIIYKPSNKREEVKGILTVESKSTNAAKTVFDNTKNGSTSPNDDFHSMIEDVTRIFALVL